MWVSGITQGLMWREYSDDGYLVYSFAETVAALFPYYVIRAVGGLFYLAGAILFVYNIVQTIRGRTASEERPAREAAALQPAE
jgi:cytochrome c oxidase cbb3-type subunit 1